jgi:hypothetical protein
LCFVGVFVIAVKIVYHGCRRGDTVQALAQWWHPVASSEALDSWYHHICMMMKIANDLLALFVLIDFNHSHYCK